MPKTDNKYEIFTSLEDIQIKNSAIDLLRGYPNHVTHTLRYRQPFKHPTEDLWAGIVDDELVGACASMSDQECSQYYDRSNLVDYDYLKANGWFVDGD
jgi:hypothetical protein